ncbi:hypothetical protein Tco_0748301 [Tanacetum coccineum]|uniref:Uncharacterized protein n=1 Tax=Tanacetum coccineum TaxID=301880 RepID=A0ABQ4YXV8_9ASTR
MEGGENGSMIWMEDWRWGGRGIRVRVDRGSGDCSRASLSFFVGTCGIGSFVAKGGDSEEDVEKGERGKEGWLEVEIAFWEKNTASIGLHGVERCGGKKGTICTHDEKCRVQEGADFEYILK